MTSFLVSTESNGNLEASDSQLEAASRKHEGIETDKISLRTPEDALEALRSKPGLTLLARTLGWLTTEPRNDANHVFTVKKPSAKAAQILFVLVNDIIPDYWQILNARRPSEHPKEKRMLIACLRSVAGIGALISRLRMLVTSVKGNSQNQTSPLTAAKSQPVQDLIEVLDATLSGESRVLSIWRSIDVLIEDVSQKSLQWKELLSLLASGKVLSIASEASLFLKDTNLVTKECNWIGDGRRYSAWLGNNMCHMNKGLPLDDIEGREALSRLLKNGLNLGYTDQVVEGAFTDLLGGDESSLSKEKALISKLLVREQRLLLSSIIATVSRRVSSFESSSATAKSHSELDTLKGISALIAALVADSEALRAGIIDWLVGVSAKATGYSHSMHRAAIAALSNDNEQLLMALQKSFELFGDKLYIKHSPVLHQEVTAQILLMLAGYVFREDRAKLVNIGRSSVYLNSISNRLAASSSRARFLGMVVGTAMSELIDAEDKRMVFGAEELQGPHGLWYKSLTHVQDDIGSIRDLKVSPSPARKPTKIKNATNITGKTAVSTKQTRPGNATSRIISIEEIEGSSDEEDLPMYEKPDSDPSDEDEDPTIVQRDRPTAPVYIRDLVAGLRDTENFDRHKLALTNAAQLIRRKAAFGSEVSDNIEELATLLVGLSDKWETVDFQKYRLQGMIAVLIAEPLRMGQWCSRILYNGDYSIGQRASVLTTLGMAARELAGLGKEDAALTGANANETAFPSKRLPEKLHKVYAVETAPMNALSAQLEKTMIQPMAASAADQLTGPNALKVRTFSSRMAVEKKRQKPIPNALAKIVAEGFFFPLTGRWRIHLQTYGENSSHTDPFLLAHFLKTLSLILHASGSSTLSLPQMTSEFWDLLLSLRPRALDPLVLEALLFAFLTLLDINESDQRRVAEEQAKELLETQGWVEGVFERVGGGSEEGERIRMLAAGVLVRTREVVERYQRMLMGDLIDYM